MNIIGTRMTTESVARAHRKIGHVDPDTGFVTLMGAERMGWGWRR